MCPQSDSTATTQIHGGNPAAVFHAAPVAPPVHLSAAYSFSRLADAREAFAQRVPAFTYARTGSPTVALLERRMAELEGGTGAVATASGQAALTVLLLTLAGHGGHIVASERIYGGTADLLNDTLADAGLTVTWVDPHSPTAWEHAITADTRALLVEAIGNPHADLADLPALARIGREHDVPLVVDSTLATPYLVRPGALGADFVVHSATKYLTGNGSALAGVVINTGNFSPLRRPERWPQFTEPTARFGYESLTDRFGADGAVLHLARAKYLHDLGPTLAPWNAQQVLDGIQTLDVRMQRHCVTAEDIARRLNQHPLVSRVRHPSVPGSRDAAVARRDYPRGTGAVLSFELEGDEATVERFIDALELIILAANIGDARTMVSHPISMTHCRLCPELLEHGEITPSTVRLAVGREDPDDLWADLERGFAAALAEAPAIPTATTAR
ncbi:O-acetylhomoserine aminocarboxypropyltransferase/cysteine synthase family protein [Citricoccus muralis]|uniref:PLP-dependent transferase n=1 Tax=Citricoccus muralis TaxID=169134 RepID=A0ABY8H6V3_9MICC|nr:PLP-dependent transferase [Citricoccus muralis]WFP16882.1 PLP-dependent transferase [Citricoccus muralis]